MKKITALLAAASLAYGPMLLAAPNSSYVAAEYTSGEFEQFGGELDYDGGSLQIGFASESNQWFGLVEYDVYQSEEVAGVESILSLISGGIGRYWLFGEEKWALGVAGSFGKFANKTKAGGDTVSSESVNGQEGTISLKGQLTDQLSVEVRGRYSDFSRDISIVSLRGGAFYAFKPQWALSLQYDAITVSQSGAPSAADLDITGLRAGIRYYYGLDD